MLLHSLETGVSVAKWICWFCFLTKYKCFLGLNKSLKQGLANYTANVQEYLGHYSQNSERYNIKQGPVLHLIT